MYSIDSWKLPFMYLDAKKKKKFNTFSNCKTKYCRDSLEIV